MKRIGLIERSREAKRGQLLLRRATAAAMLDTSINMMKALEKAGRLTPIKLHKSDVFYSREQIAALARGE
jgi:hypothetical protein